MQGFKGSLGVVVMGIAAFGATYIAASGEDAAIESAAPAVARTVAPPPTLSAVASLPRLAPPPRPRHQKPDPDPELESEEPEEDEPQLEPAPERDPEPEPVDPPAPLPEPAPRPKPPPPPATEFLDEG